MTNEMIPIDKEIGDMLAIFAVFFIDPEEFRKAVG